MRILICGDRNWNDEKTMEGFFNTLPDNTVIIEGECKGADKMARRQGEKRGFQVLGFPADWNKYGKIAGPIRNIQMLEEGNPDLVVAFHNDLSKSKGTKNMIKQAMDKGVRVKVICSGTQFL